jgi:hypothetical protein
LPTVLATLAPGDFLTLDDHGQVDAADPFSARPTDWLLRAYNENAAPPPPRRPARRPAPVLGPLTVVIEGFDLTCDFRVPGR